MGSDPPPKRVFSRQQIALVSDLGTVVQTAPTVPSPAANKVLLVTDDTRFDRNETRIGTGEVLLPEPF